MDIIRVLILALIIVAVSVAGMAITILIKKNGKFPNTHVGSNPNMKKKGLMCARKHDAMEQSKANKARKKSKFEGLKPIRE